MASSSIACATRSSSFTLTIFPISPRRAASAQSWIIPYLADLVGAAPVSPFADGQRDEVANAIRWSKRKGTLVAVEEIIETIALSEAELQEGWSG